MHDGPLYYVSGTTAATAATDQHAIAQIWNPSTTRTIVLVEGAIVVFGAPGAGAGFLIRRSSARGTAGSTVTPNGANHYRNDAAPDSGFVLDLAAFTTQPTLVVGDLGPAWVLPAVTASGIVYPMPRGIEIPPGGGLCFVNRAAIAFPTAEVSVQVAEV